MNQPINASELIINEDGSIFHLHLCPNQLADKVILMGDQGRVNQFKPYFDKIEHEVSSREFHTITGYCKGKRITALSTGIGCDNIDIVMTELDALANIDFETRSVKKCHTTLDIVRVGTCGGLQSDTQLGTFIVSQKGIGFDGLLNFYKKRNAVCDLDMEKDFVDHMNWCQPLCIPYVVDANSELIERIAKDDMKRGITISCGGFYGPQCREIRTPLMDSMQNTKVQIYRYKDLQILNYEMENSAILGMSKLLGHRAVTCCVVVANRYGKEALPNYKDRINNLIETVLDRI